MRVAVIADIHGNLTALDAVLEDLSTARIDQLVCLGDVVATGPQPHETAERLRALNCPVVMGNADAASLRTMHLSPSDDDGHRFSEIDAWCTAQLSAEDLSFLRGFQPTVSIALGGDATLLCFHGSPRSNTDPIVATTPETTLAEMLDGYSATVMTGGHTHLPFIRRYQQAALFNPGSVGLPYEITEEGARNPARAEYGIVEWRAQALSIELRQVALDVQTVIHAALHSDMPHADWWASGWR